MSSFKSASARVMETRSRNGLRYRRYRDGDTSFWTVEVPVEVFRGSAPPSKVADRMAAWKRSIESKKKAALAMQKLAAGEKAVAVAHELGLDVRSVYRYASGQRRGRASSGATP